MRRRFALVVTIVFAAAQASAKPVKICVQNDPWFPFSFVDGSAIKGVFVDMTNDALKAVGDAADYQIVPWERCLKENGAKGLSDAVVGASYKPERAETLIFPNDTPETAACQSKYKLLCVDYVVVSVAADKFEFGGDVKALPEPVRAPDGFSIVKDLEGQGVKVDTAKSDLINVRKLIRDGKGVAVMIKPLAEHLAKSKEFEGKIRIHGKSITNKSYFLTFSKKGSLSSADQQKIWDALAKIAADEKAVQGYFAKYSKDE